MKTAINNMNHWILSLKMKLTTTPTWVVYSGTECALFDHHIVVQDGHGRISNVITIIITLA